jgi:hypothetical protein
MLQKDHWSKFPFIAVLGTVWDTMYIEDVPILSSYSVNLYRVSILYQHFRLQYVSKAIYYIH